MPAPGRQLRVFCLDVGQGDCTFVLPPDNKPPVLFDCKDAHVARMFVRSQRQPIHELSAVVFSHLDDDHIAGGEQFIKDFLDGGGRIQRIFLDADRDVSRQAKGSRMAKSLIDFARSLERAGQIELLAPRGDPAEVDRNARSERDWSVRIVGPRQGLELDMARGETEDAPNIHSAVLKAEFAGKAVLIGGDAPLVSWAQIRREDISAAVFRIPHHGGALDDGGVPAGWTAQRLYDEVAPGVGVLSVGTRNLHGHPRAEWVRPLLRRRGCHTLCTQLTPQCEPAIAADDRALAHRAWALRYAEEALPAWRHRPDGRAPRAQPPPREVPCAGSVAIVVHDDGRLTRFPEDGAGHTQHVLPRIARAWCVHGPP